METLEAFRISLGKINNDRLADDHVEMITQYQKTICRLLSPLQLHNRLRFVTSSNSDSKSDDNWWLVVEVESSRQMTLLNTGGDDGPTEELDRECVAAENLINRAMTLFRKLVAYSRMSPVEFHSLLNQEEIEFNEARRIGELAGHHEDGLITLRNPIGQDLTVKAEHPPRAVTLPEVRRGRFLVDMVGLTHALVRHASADESAPRPLGKGMRLVWGDIADRPALTEKFYNAMITKTVLPVSSLETFSSKGKVLRLEWCNFG